MSGAGLLLVPQLVADWEGGGDAPAAGARLWLAASRCRSCTTVDFPRRETCARCHAVMEPTTLGPRGQLVGHTAVLHQPPGALVTAPYAVGNALFDGGLAITGLLTGGEPAIGDPVEVVAVELGDGSLTFGFALRERPTPYL